jgi:hypothetical protein
LVRELLIHVMGIHKSTSIIIILQWGVNCHDVGSNLIAAKVDSAYFGISTCIPSRTETVQQLPIESTMYIPRSSYRNIDGLVVWVTKTKYHGIPIILRLKGHTLVSACLAQDKKEDETKGCKTKQDLGPAQIVGLLRSLNY